MFAANGQFLSPHHEPAEGPKAIERVLRQYGDAGYQDLRYETLRVDSSGDTAIETGRFSLAVRQANGTTAMERGKYLHVWRRVGVWLMVANCRRGICSISGRLDAVPVVGRVCVL